MKYILSILLLNISFYTVCTEQKQEGSVYLLDKYVDNFWFLEAGHRYLAKCSDISVIKSKYPGLEYNHIAGDIYVIAIPDNFPISLLEKLKKETSEVIYFEEPRYVRPCEEQNGR